MKGDTTDIFDLHQYERFAVQGSGRSHSMELRARPSTLRSGDSLPGRAESPGGHHRTSGLYQINIHLALPEGREVNVARTPPADERHADLTFAINDAFKHARRQLQDHVRRMQDQVKHHEDQPI
jgi:hypothetical protein